MKTRHGKSQQQEVEDSKYEKALAEVNEIMGFMTNQP